MLTNISGWTNSGLQNKETINVHQSQYLRSVVDDINHNPGAEIMRYARHKTNILGLGQGEGDVPTPDFIVEEAVQALRAGHTLYGPPLGMPEIRTELSSYYKRIYGLDISRQRMVLTPSGTAAVHLAMMAVCDKDDEVIAVTPMWKNLLGAIQLQEAHTTEVSLHPDPQDGHKWKLDLEELFGAVTPVTRAIIINSPSNPTGWVMPLEDMKKVMDFARDRGIWIISDEVYGRMVFDQTRAPSFLDIAEEDDRLIIINSFSKNWSMTGWRLGWMVVPEQAEQNFYDLVLYDYMCPQSFSQYAGLKALREGEGFLAERMAWYKRARDIVDERFARMPRITAHSPESSFYSFFKVKGHDDCVGFCKELIDKTGLCLAPGCAFGQESCGYIRMCYAVSEPKLLDALDRLEQVVGRE